MLVSLSRYHKSIAWFFTLLFYGQLVLIPLSSRGESYRMNPALASSLRPVKPHWVQTLFLPAGPVTPSTDAVNVLPTMVPGHANEPMRVNTVVSSSKADGTGPGQPEMQAFTSVGSANMVDLFSGDFSYNIPLMDVGGYPVNLAYRAGITMDQEASWVGLGWNVNPGTISRNLRGLPDDFNGRNDSVKKEMTVKDNNTIGISGSADVEIVGMPKPAEGQKQDTLYSGLTTGVSFGVYKNNYRGWGMEFGINASINSGRGAKGPFSGGLSLTNSTMDGASIAPSLSVNLSLAKANEDGAAGSFSLSTSYSSRSGMRALQLGMGVSNTDKDSKNQRHTASSGISSFISFAYPAITPTITLPYTSRQFSFTAKVGLEFKASHPNYSLSGYSSSQYIAQADKSLSLPAYGYLHYQDGTSNRASLLDFNREKELAYREKPAVPHIAIPSYTYDAFSITGEGTGGMFRAYRSDIGFVYDHFIRTRDESDKLSLDIGFGDMVHGGIDLNITRAYTQTGPWLGQRNLMQTVVDFRRDSGAFEAAYFRNPGEKSINDRNYYDRLGGDDVVTVGLSQKRSSDENIYATTFLRRYRDGRYVDTSRLTRDNAVKQERDKRTQVISYLTADEAAATGLQKYIEYHQLNAFDSVSCVTPSFTSVTGPGTGLKPEYFRTPNLKGPIEPLPLLDQTVNFNYSYGNPYEKSSVLVPPKKFINNRFSVRWTGLVMAPATGYHTFSIVSDDGIRLWLNDTLLINHWIIRGAAEDTVRVKLEKGKLYKIRLEYFENTGKASISLRWKRPGSNKMEVIPTANLYPPPTIDTFEHNNIVRELRVNNFRKANHISEVDVLNNDGRRYVYGIPVYNLRQKEATFSLNKDSGNRDEGVAGYVHGSDNTINNGQNRDRYFSSEEMPAYAHSFLLTGILSADYSDVTGNGITDDDIGDAVKFNYTKVAGIRNPFGWRTPAKKDTVTFNEGLRTDYRDNKGNYIYGQKELWYLHSIESKTMIATFVLEDRYDVPGLKENGDTLTSGPRPKLLRKINLYSKADFAAKRTNAIPVKTVHFDYTYELCPGAYSNGKGKLTLKRVWFTYNGNDKNPNKPENPYLFNYNSKNPAYSLQGNDRWGNYKDRAQNPGNLSNAEYVYSVQDSAAAAQNAAAWALDSIYLPSGGALKITYEGDDYGYVQNKRAMQMLRVVGAGTSPVWNESTPQLFHKSGASGIDHRYVFIRLPKPVSNLQELYQLYLQDLKKLYFRMHVGMPADSYGNGYEYVPCYADLEATNSYGLVNSSLIWVKLAGISLKGDKGGDYSPLAVAAAQFMRLNLPSKAFPDSETGNDLSLVEAIKLLGLSITGVASAFKSYEQEVRRKERGAYFDTTKSLVRLNNPWYKKMGGGHRVKRVTVYDNWNRMTNQQPAIYGQEYSYTTTLPGDSAKIISSGVASYEPGLGGEENPFHYPVEYVEKVAALGPVTLGYSEEPMGESFFPAAGIGYSKVRVRTINYKKVKSANGFEETQFYTAYDYPTYTDRTLLDGDTKKRFRPDLRNLLRVNSRHHIVLSQGFKIELNDMHGKLRSQASYAETDLKNPVTYSEQFYKTDNASMDAKRLRNVVAVMDPRGRIDTAALIGKDVELMMDMREQVSVTNGYNVSLNTELFSVAAVPPVWLIPSMLNLAQREENIYRSVATVKIIQRYGIVDSAVQIDKGSRISTQDLLYDSETGDVLLTRTQNEFNDPIYTINYPSHWAYDGMGLAYKNIDATLEHVTIRDGVAIGLTDQQKALFSSGDEILVSGKHKIADSAGCYDIYTTFPDYDKVWAIDSSALYGGPHALYFIDRAGKAYNGYDVALRIIRSGRRNVLGSVGSVTTLVNPLQKDGSNQYHLVLNTGAKVVAAAAGEFRQVWKIDDILRKRPTVSCVPNWVPDGNVRCLKVQPGDTINTGFQQIEVVDVNPYSPTYNDTLWQSFGLNCQMCPKPSKWILTDSVSCELDASGNYTGRRLQGEVDTANCSGSVGIYRFVKIRDSVCGVCPVPSRWAFTGVDSCERDSNHVKTGYLLRQQRDSACSSSKDSIRWIRERNCVSCSKPAQWLAFDSSRCVDGYTERLYINMQGCSDSAWIYKWFRIGGQGAASWEDVAGQVRCQKNNDSVTTGVRLKLQVNTASCGDSAGMQRWVFVDSCVACFKPAIWVDTEIDSCLKDFNGNYTGYKVIRQINMEPCHAPNDTVRWRDVLDCATCAKPKNWQNTDTMRCEIVSGNKTGYRQRWQRNVETCSDSAGMGRWIKYDMYCDTCGTIPQWTITGDSCQRVIDHGGYHYTGYRVIVLTDTSPCGAGNTRDSLIYSPHTCSEPEPPSDCVYAEIIIPEADKRTVSVPGANPGDFDIYTYGNVYVKFYEDATLTDSVSVTNMWVPIVENVSTTSNPSGTNSYYSVLCSGYRSIIRANTLLYVEHFAGTVDTETYSFAVNSPGSIVCYEEEWGLNLKRSDQAIAERRVIKIKVPKTAIVK